MPPKPLATGNFEKTPFAHLLVYMEQRSMSGTLAVWPDPADGAVRGQDRVLVLKGQLVGARLLTPAPTLEDGLLGLFSRSAAPYAFYEGNLLGDGADRLAGRVDPYALIATFLRGDDTRDDLVAGMLGRVGEAALALSPQADLSRFDFTDDEYTFVQRIAGGPAPISTLATGGELDQLRSLRVLYLLLICKAIAPLPAAPARPAPAAIPPPAPPPPAGAPPPPVALPPAEFRSPPLDLMDVMIDLPGEDAPVPATPVPPSAPTGPSHPDILPSSIAPSVPTSLGHSPLSDASRLNSIPPPAEGLSDEHRKQWLRIVATGKLIENQNYFEMLGVPKTAKATEVRAEFVRVAKEWHPDRMPPELAKLKPFVQSIFGFMSEAHACLSDEKQRLPYLQSVREGGGTPATDRLMQRILDSAMQYERVLVYTRKHDYASALELLQKILQVTSDEPDYHAMFAWLLMQGKPAKDDPSPPYREMLVAVDTALKLHPEHEKANLYKAQILRRMGRHKDALEWFRKVVRVNPNNLEAAREVRIAQMRGQSSHPRKKDKDSAGLFGKLFKKK